MANLQSIYAAIKILPDPVVDRALAAALPTAEPSTLGLIVDTILQRDRPEGLLGLVMHYDRLGPAVRQTLVERAHDLFRPIREAIGMPATPGAANAVTLIREAGLTRLAYLLTEGLRHGPDDLKDRAAECLRHLAGRAVDPATPPHRRIAPEDAPFLLSAVQDAVAAYGQHRRADVLAAYLMLLPRPMPDAATRLDDPRHAAAEATAAALRRPADAATAAALVPMLALPNQTHAAIAGLRAINAHGRLGEGVTAFHLLSLAAVRRGLARAKTTSGLSPTPASLAQASVDGRRGLVAFVAAVPEDPRERTSRLLQLTKTSDRLARLMALRRLMALSARTHDEAAEEAIATLCGDADVDVDTARLALRHLTRVKYRKLPAVLTTLVTSPHPELRRLAGDRLAPMAFDRLWSNWPQLDRSQRLSAGRAIIKIDPTFHRTLGERLSASDRDTRLRALAVIAELHQGEFFREALLQLSASGDAYVASAAVRALGSAGGDPVLRALEAALSHADGRVRANAIEALADLRSTQHVDRLVQMVEDPQNRPRANAIAALLDLRTAEAVAALRLMLDDDRSAHRHSALWLIETVGLLDLARNVAERSLSDPDGQVRDRARGVVEQLMGLMGRARDEDTPTNASPSPVAVAAGGAT